MVRNQDEVLEKEGYVTAAKIARATSAVLSTVHRQIAAGRIPGKKVGSGWYVDVHAYALQFEPTGPGQSVRRALDELRKSVPKPTTKAARKPS